MLTAAESALFAESSVARARSVCVPLLNKLVLNVNSYGGTASRPYSTPSTYSSTCLTAALSAADARTAIVPETVVLSEGARIAALGGVVSPVAGGVW